MSGILYLCATPIGNLEDITLRVIKTLKEVDLIAAEDTRHSIKLLNHYDIKTPMTSYHEHNKEDKGLYLIKEMKAGKNIALITDAGTPAISDPGEELVRQAYEAGIKVTSLPGACALITALTISGLSTGRFCFEGFLPSKKRDRSKLLEILREETRTIILYEAPHRLKRTLKELHDSLGNRNIALVKELTKLHEEAFNTSLLQAIDFYHEKTPRGEFVLLIEGKSIEEIEEEKESQWKRISVQDHMEIYLSKGLNKKDSMKAVAKDRGKGKREIYRKLLDNERRD